MIFKKLRMKHGWYDLRTELAKWVEKDLGTEYVNEALESYDKINSGEPMGNFAETVVFLEMIEQVKKDM